MAEPSTIVASEPLSFLRLTGKDRVGLVHRLSTNDLRPLEQPGRALRTVLTNEKGRVVDWLTVVARAEELWLCGAAGRGERLRAWLERFVLIDDVDVADASAAHALVMVEGPRAAEGCGLTALCEPGLTTEAGGLVYWRAVAAYPERAYGVGPAAAVEAAVGEAVRRGARLATTDELERRRIEAGVPSAEREYAALVSPLELRLERDSVSFEKGCYVGQEVIARLDAYDKLARVLIGVRAEAAAGEGEILIERGGKAVGRVTSLVASGDGGVGLGVVERASATPGPVVLVQAGTRWAGRLEDRPFWTAHSSAQAR